MRTASWVIREKATGRIIMETFNPALAASLAARPEQPYEAVPILQHLQELNRSIKAGLTGR